MARVRPLIAVVLLVAVTASCGSDPSTSAPASGASEVLAFEAPLLDGGTFRGEDLAGKDVAFWFWAPW